MAPPDGLSTRRVLRRLFLTVFLRGRSARGMRGGAKGAPKSVVAKLALTLLVYGLFGAMALFFSGQQVFALSLYLHASTLVFLGMFIASSAGEVLFNKEEADILLHRPVAPGELLWAKIAVLVQVSLWVAGAFNAVGLVAGMRGLGGARLFYPLAHAGSLILEALFTTGGVVLLYQLCLRWCGRERLEAVMTAVQTLTAILAVLAGQIAPRLLFFMRGGLRVDTGHWWIWLLPPAWFAGIDDALAGTHAPLSFAMGSVGVLLTLLVLWLAFGKLAESYGVGLQRLGETSAPAEGARSRRRRRWLDTVASRPPLAWILRDPVERAAFRLTAAYLFRDREIKLRIYPGLAPVLVMPIVLLLPFTSRDAQASRGLADGFKIAFAGGYLGIVPLIALGMLQQSQQWAASDVFRYAPIGGPGRLCHGARCAVLVFLALPLAAGFALMVWAITHDAARLWLLLPGLMLLPLCGLGAALGGQGTPLSRPPEEGKASARGMITIMFIIPAMSISLVASWAASEGWLWPFLAGETVVAATLYAVLRRSVSRLSWTQID